MPSPVLSKEFHFLHLWWIWWIIICNLNLPIFFFGYHFLKAHHLKSLLVNLTHSLWVLFSCDVRARSQEDVRSERGERDRGQLHQLPESGQSRSGPQPGNGQSQSHRSREEETVSWCSWSRADTRTLGPGSPPAPPRCGGWEVSLGRQCKSEKSIRHNNVIRGHHVFWGQRESIQYVGSCNYSYILHFLWWSIWTLKVYFLNRWIMFIFWLIANVANIRVSELWQVVIVVMRD